MDLKSDSSTRYHYQLVEKTQLDIKVHKIKVIAFSCNLNYDYPHRSRVQLDFLALVFRREEVPGWLEPASHGLAAPSRGTDLDSVAAVERLKVTVIADKITKHREI